ncbi:hypothetical protein D915_000838 [Fasciola hepatica]|uniref:Zinc finger, C2H2 type n=1 Tax=Fasciola hepatica TaxID=6192 RepID=A0A4E0S326_FASHE|nr:hypothetical protein D915_000838 [Fasciola hepatica]
MSGAPKEACDLYFHQSSTVMPVSMLEFDVDSENYMLPVPGYLPQQDFNCAGGFSSSSCVPLVPLSSVLIPVSGEVADVDGAGNVVGTTDYNVSSVCEAYTCIPPSNHGISADSIQPTDMQSSVTNNTGPIEAQPSIIYSMDSAPLSTPLVSFVDAPGYNDQYATVSTSASCVVTEAAASTSTALVPVKKCGRPRKTPVSVDPDLIKTAIVANSTAEVPPYDPSHFWCPLCGMAYTVSVCPIHPIAVELDRVVPTYARLTLPAGLELDDKPEAVRVLCTRRWPPCTRFGPVVAPLVTEAQLQLCPDWWPSCSFRLDPPTNSSEPVRYLKLSDESVCNWMMFVRREETLSVTSKRQRRPNCVAYQSGSEGIFFLTTKAIRPGEELLVTLAPPYANRSHSIAHSQSESDAAIKLPTGQPRPKRSIPSDEIHCFRCSITFDSEEAFRVHCLGHPDESAVRGFVDVDETTTASSETTFGRDRPPSRPDTGYIRLRKPVSKDGQNASVSIGKHIVYFRSTLQCSICFTSFQGLPKLVEHTNTAHSISHPRIFKRVPNSLPALTPSYFGDVADEFVTAGDLDSEQLIDKSGSSNMPPLYDFHGSNPLSVLSAENFIVVDLTNASQNLLEQTFWAYGCGQCKQRFPSMLALEQHKDALHNEGNPSSLAVSHQLQLDELLLPTQFTESASAVLVPPENKGDAMHQNVATREDPCACNVQQISSESEMIFLLIH